MARTTISIDESTKAQLDDIKRVDGESYDSVVKLLIAQYGGDGDLSEERVREIADEQISERVVVEAQE
jgi:hypothetical protein